MNKVFMTGNLVQDIELKVTKSGTNVVQNTIAVRRNYKNEQGEYDSDFITFVAWKNDADYLKSYAKKGDRLEIVGSWRTRKVENENGFKVYHELIVEEISVFSNKAKETKEEEEFSYEDAMKNNRPTKNDIDNADLPF